jgi:hypothetical protein
LAELLEDTALFKQVTVHKGPVEVAAEELVREPAAAVIYTGESGRVSGGSLRRELVFIIVLKTIALGRGNSALKEGFGVLDTVLASFRELPLASWRIDSAAGDRRENIHSLELTCRLKD